MPQPIKLIWDDCRVKKRGISTIKFEVLLAKNMTTNPSSIPFRQTEELFFLSCVGEVLKVWASKSGQAKLNISVENGMADLQLAFKLGLPGDSHLPSSPYHHPPKYKSPSRKARAAAQQQAQAKDFHNQLQKVP